MQNSRVPFCRVVACMVALVLGFAATSARAQSEPEPDLDAAVTPPPVAAASPPAPPSTSDAGATKEEEKKPIEVTPLGYVEAYYAYNFNRPSNGITNFRGFDNRHNSFTLQNVALGANFTAGPVGGRIV